MAPLSRLSKREVEVVELLLQGNSNKLIAGTLGISNRTVEFHLKNIYTKFQVSSRTELILKLVKAAGSSEIKELGYSTVVSEGKSAENGETSGPGLDWGESLRETITIPGEELEIKNLLNSTHVLVGVMTALFTGSIWIALLKHFGHMSLNSILPWILPLVFILAIIGFSIGLVGKRNENAPGKVFLSTLVGTGTGAFAMMPLVAFVVYPLAKLIEWLGLVNRSAIPTDVTSTLVIVVMIGIWLVVGIVIGTMLLFVRFGKSGLSDLQRHAPEHGL